MVYVHQVRLPEFNALVTYMKYFVLCTNNGEMFNTLGYTSWSIYVFYIYYSPFLHALLDTPSHLFRCNTCKYGLLVHE